MSVNIELWLIKVLAICLFCCRPLHSYVYIFICHFVLRFVGEAERPTGMENCKMDDGWFGSVRFGKSCRKVKRDGIQFAFIAFVCAVCHFNSIWLVGISFFGSA